MRWNFWYPALIEIWFQTIGRNIGVSTCDSISDTKKKKNARARRNIYADVLLSLFQYWSLNPLFGLLKGLIVLKAVLAWLLWIWMVRRALLQFLFSSLYLVFIRAFLRQKKVMQSNYLAAVLSECKFREHQFLYFDWFNIFRYRFS